MASRGHKGSLPLVPLTYSDEVVRAAEVQLGKDIVAPQRCSRAAGTRGSG